MNIIVKEPGKQAYHKSIEGTLQEMQEIVGGYIEVVAIGPNLLMVCNEEGKQRGLQPNFKLGMDIICGTVFFCAASGEDMIGLSLEHARAVRHWLDGLEGDPDERG